MRALCLWVFMFFSTAHFGQTTYIVNASDDTDDGVCNGTHCSLREAINAANNDGIYSIIEFAIGGGGLAATISIFNALPILTEDGTTIDGMTQNGLPGGVSIDCQGIGVQQEDILSIFGDNTEVYGLEMYGYTVQENATVEGSGSMIGVGGLFTAASPTNVTIGAPGRGNIIHSLQNGRTANANFANGISVHSGGNIVIQSNRIGMSYDAAQALPVWGSGIRINENQTGSTYIGGDLVGQANIIGNCNYGIGIFGGDGWVKGNYIGTDPSKTLRHPNKIDGIILTNGDFYEIGGSGARDGNHCYYNSRHGISVNTPVLIYLSRNECAYNGGMNSGIDILACPNCWVEKNICYGQQNGISITDLGGTEVIVQENELFDNTNGVYMSWTPTSTNLIITENSIYCNSSRGISSVVSGTSPFDNILYSSISSSEIIGTCNPNAVVELFVHDTTGCPDAFCQGKYFIDVVTADNVGVFQFNGSFIPGATYTTTQTIQPRNITSPFGPCLMIPECNTLVTHTGDSGSGSLRGAIECANAHPGPDTIFFDIPGGANEQIIRPNSPLPVIIDGQTIIDASSQPFGRVILEGQNLPPFSSGLSFQADSCALYSMTIRNFGLNGVEIGGPTLLVSGMIIGAPGKGNFIHGCANGIELYSKENLFVQGNIIGSDTTYSGVLPANNIGCLVNLEVDARNIFIGGKKSLMEGNVFVNSLASGLQLISTDEVGDVQIKGNFFGTDPFEKVALPNVQAQSPAMGALTLTLLGGTTIGGGTEDDKNIFAFNEGPGVFVVFDRHHIRNNSFYCNTTGIDLNNSNQNGNINKPAPKINMATTALVSGTSLPFDTIELYMHGDTTCPDADCQGRALFALTFADGGGNWVATPPFLSPIQTMDIITALSHDNIGNTSTFSPCVQICPEAMIQVSNNGPHCQGDSISLYSSITTNGTNIEYSWSGPNGYSSSDANPKDASLGGTYILHIDIDGCTYPPQSTEVLVLASDTVIIDTMMCSNQMLIVGNEVFDTSRTSGTVVLKTQNQCDSIVMVTIEFMDNLERTLDDTLCSGDFLWINGKKYDEDTPRGREVIPSNEGCDSILIVDLSFIQPSVENLSFQACRGASLTINGRTYDEGNPSGTDTLINQFGCDSIVNIQVEFGDASTLQVDTTLCEGDYLEFNNIRYDQFYPAGRDTLVGGSTGGCDSIIDVHIEYYDPSVVFDTLSPTCQGGDDGAIIIKSIEGIPGPFTVTFNGIGPINIDTLPFRIDQLDEGDYTLVVSDATQCNHAFRVFLEQVGGLDITLQNTFNIASGDSVDLAFQASFSPDSVYWIHNGDTLCIDCNPLTVQPTESSEYTLHVYHEGCFSEYVIFVNVELNLQFFFPNTFSPDGNNINDIFTGFSKDKNVVIELLEVYSRWGELIYKGENLSPNGKQGWDGTYNGQLLPTDVYVYKALIRFPSRITETRVGQVTIVR